VIDFHNDESLGTILEHMEKIKRGKGGTTILLN
jgi:hypothetical protein